MRVRGGRECGDIASAACTAIDRSAPVLKVLRSTRTKPGTEQSPRLFIIGVDPCSTACSYGESSGK
jgi:hypothetical protein